MMARVKQANMLQMSNVVGRAHTCDQTCQVCNGDITLAKHGATSEAGGRDVFPPSNLLRSNKHCLAACSLFMEHKEIRFVRHL